MTKEEGKEFANALKNNYTIDFDKLPEFCDLVISALEKNESAEEWYKLLCEKWDSAIEGDLISRQAVENITWEEPSYSDPLNVLTEVRDKVRALPSVENKGEWIPVSERLPEEKLAVLVWCPEYKNIYCAYCANGNWWIFGAFSQIIPNAVIAWQPLPEPYKGESEVKPNE